VNLATGGVNDPDEAKRRFNAAVDRVKDRGWHVQVYTNASMIPLIKDAFVASPVTVVFDHFGGAQAAAGLQQPGFPELVELVKSGKAYVKISGAYRSSNLGPEYSDVAPFAKALIAANPDRIIWGTDWPHPEPGTYGLTVEESAGLTALRPRFQWRFLSDERTDLRTELDRAALGSDGALAPSKRINELRKPSWRPYARGSRLEATVSPGGARRRGTPYAYAFSPQHVNSGNRVLHAIR
jgi:hypothetical protein